MWKCATTNSVCDSGTSTGTLPRYSPDRPPLTNVKTKPMANSIGTVKWMLPRHRVSTQLYTFKAVGIAMIRVVVAKKKPKYRFIPLTNMWCAQTTKLRPPMIRMAHTIIR